MKRSRPQQLLTPTNINVETKRQRISSTPVHSTTPMDESPITPTPSTPLRCAFQQQELSKSQLMRLSFDVVLYILSFHNLCISERPDFCCWEVSSQSGEEESVDTTMMDDLSDSASTATTTTTASSHMSFNSTMFPFSPTSDDKPSSLLYILYGYFSSDPYRTISLMFPNLDVSCSRLVYGTSMKHLYQILPNVSLLQSLDLSDNVICMKSQLQPVEAQTPLNRKIFSRTNRLQYLNISGNNKLGSEVFHECILEKGWLSTSLRTLDISNTSLSPSYICNSLLKDCGKRRFPGLTVLRMSHMYFPIVDEHIRMLVERNEVGECLLSGITSLDISYNQVTSESLQMLIQALCYSSDEATLEHLNVANNSITTLDQCMTELSNDGKAFTLKSLDLSLNNIVLQRSSDSQANMFDKMTSLTLYQSNLVDKTLECIISWFPALNFLDVSDNDQLKDLQLNSNNLPQLHHLKLNGNSTFVHNWLSVGSDDELVLPKSLRTLELETCQIGNEEFSSLIRGIRSNKAQLMHLNIRQNAITDDFVEDLWRTRISTRGLSSVRKLNISGNRLLSDACAEYLVRLFPNVRQLDCSYCSFSEASFVTLLKSFRQIQSLNMAHNEMFMVGAIQPVNSPDVDNFRQINIHRRPNLTIDCRGQPNQSSRTWINNAKPSDVDMLSPGTPTTPGTVLPVSFTRLLPATLTELNLSGNNITDQFAIQLLLSQQQPRVTSHLQSLDLQDNDLTDRTLKYGLLQARQQPTPSPSHSNKKVSLKFLDLSGNDRISDFARDAVLDKCDWIDTLYCEIGDGQTK